MGTAANSSEKSYWIVVADESKAIVYTRETRRSPLQQYFSIDNSVARTKTADLITDRGGRSFDSHGHGRHTFAKEKAGPKKHASIAFAKEIVQRIIAAKKDGSCRDFALIAAPRFLGTIRGALPSTPGAEPFLTIDKDVVGEDTGVIEKLLER